MNKLLSIIIVTYNSEKLIFDCLDSIYKFNDIGDALEIVIVDNCSRDCEFVFNKIKLEYPKDIVLVRATSNNGYGAGNNLGVQHVTSPYFIVMNPDVRLVEPVFCKIISKFNDNPNAGMFGVRFKDKSNHLYFKPEYENLFRLFFGNILIRFRCYKIEQMFFSGSFLVFDKKYFLEAGSFDENIFLFYEEADISNRILFIGKETLLAKDIFVLHLVHGRDVNLYLLKIGAESRKYYFKKYNANLDQYYTYILIKYHIKHIFAIILNNKIRKADYKGWIEICNNYKSMKFS